MSVQVTWVGNAFFIIRTDDALLFVDPWITGNSGVTMSVEDAIAMKPDMVLVSHGHPGHFGRGDSIAIANGAGVPYVSTSTVTSYLRDNGMAKTNCIGLTPDASINLDGVGIRMLQIPHPPEPAKMMAEAAPGAPNCLFVIEVGGKTMLHVGDTMLDPAYDALKAQYCFDVAMLPLWGAGLGFPKEQAIENIATLIGKLEPKHVMLHNRWDPALPAYNAFMERIGDMPYADSIVPQMVGTTIQLD